MLELPGIFDMQTGLGYCKCYIILQHFFGLKIFGFVCLNYLNYMIIFYIINLIEKTLEDETSPCAHCYTKYEQSLTYQYNELYVFFHAFEFKIVSISTSCTPFTAPTAVLTCGCRLLLLPDINTALRIKVRGSEGPVLHTLQMLKRLCASCQGS